MEYVAIAVAAVARACWPGQTQPARAVLDPRGFPSLASAVPPAFAGR